MSRRVLATIPGKFACIARLDLFSFAFALIDSTIRDNFRADMTHWM